jgi:NAD(P)-dependent dehydrogenase (short-subunit alcohol dehydrogenase family)
MNDANERDVRGAAFVFVGGTRGIGREVARALASRGAAVLVVGRDAERGAEVARELTERGASEASFLRADVSSIAGMAHAARGIEAWRGAIAGLVHSAMVVESLTRRVRTADGLDLAFGLQYLARHALDRALEPALARSGDGRIVLVGAQAPASTRVDLADPQFDRRRWTLPASLMASQVLGALHVQEAARRWPATVTPSIACVGMTRTETARSLAWPIRALYALAASSVGDSARNAIRALVAADAAGLRGATLLDPRRMEPTPIALDEQLARDAWALAEDLLRRGGFDRTRAER